MLTQSLNEYILHVGETGSGEGLALVWTNGPYLVPNDAKVCAASGSNQSLLIRGAEYQLTLHGVNKPLFQMAIEKGMHIIKQNHAGTVQSQFIPAG